MPQSISFNMYDTFAKINQFNDFYDILVSMQAIAAKSYGNMSASKAVTSPTLANGSRPARGWINTEGFLALKTNDAELGASSKSRPRRSPD